MSSTKERDEAAERYYRELPHSAYGWIDVSMRDAFCYGWDACCRSERIETLIGDLKDANNMLLAQAITIERMQKALQHVVDTGSGIELANFYHDELIGLFLNNLHVSLVALGLETCKLDNPVLTNSQGSKPEEE